MPRTFLHTCTCADGTASPEHYKQFMGVLCGYIVEKQQEVQGEELPFDLVFVSCHNHLCNTYMCMYSIHCTIKYTWPIKLQVPMLDVHMHILVCTLLPPSHTHTPHIHVIYMYIHTHILMLIRTHTHTHCSPQLNVTWFQRSSQPSCVTWLSPRET